VFGSILRTNLARRLAAGTRDPRINLGILGIALCGLGVLAGAVTSHAETSAMPERVRGFFCNAKDDSLFMFRPEKVERWSGTVFGSLQQPPNAKHDV
jgi:hypothetical protein